MSTNINHASYFKREILVRIAKSFFEGQLVESAHKIPVELRPSGDESLRCCIHKERAVARLRVIAALGFSAEKDNEYTPLNEYAQRAIQREQLEGKFLSVLDIACRGCVKSQYVVTELCQGCLARPCSTQCPFGAVTFKSGRASIDPDKCKNCGLCHKACPYQAISKLHVPCEEACAVKAISKNKQGIAEIDFDKCTSCGRCMTACPFGAVMEQSQIIDVLKLLGQKNKVLALVAPSIIGQFPASLGKMITAIKKLGFDDVFEVALGADETTAFEAEEFNHKMNEGVSFMTSSCCPAYIETLKRHIPELLPHASTTPTPMHFSARTIKTKHPDSQVVFIGPCVAKRVEGFHDPLVDYVLTFEELGALLLARGIEVVECDETPIENVASKQGRGFAVTQGVSQAIASLLPDQRLQSICINGLSSEGIKQLRGFSLKAPEANLIEVMACSGGCVGGPGGLASSKVLIREIQKLQKDSPELIDLLNKKEK